MTLQTIEHEAIKASAGSGKTFQLAHRYIRLLGLGVPTDTIIALTFSRKAAGEIFDGIVTYLQAAASSEEAAARTSEICKLPELDSTHFLARLRCLMDSLNRLHVGTLDSFTIGVIRAFPMELGINPDFQVLDGDGALAQLARDQVLAGLFNARQTSSEDQKSFLEAFRLATFGKEEKGLSRNLADFISNYRTIYRLHPEADAWADGRRIWPEGAVWKEGDVDPDAAAEALTEFVVAQDWPQKGVIDKWLAVIPALKGFTQDSNWDPKTHEYLFTRISDAFGELGKQTASIRFHRTDCDFPPEAGQNLLDLVNHVLQIEIGRKRVHTLGIYRLLDQFEALYRDAVLRKGVMSFDDAQYVLSPESAFGEGLRLSRKRDAEQRLFIDYRLDAQLDHWLLDEFQDTSDIQWEVLNGLIDEVVQDTSETRSFFFVGDVKQAIYGWRGGNAKLFGQLLERYEGRVNLSKLDVSYRSGRPIIETVNSVFGDIRKAKLAPEALEAWEAVWSEHHDRTDVDSDFGYAALIEPPMIDAKTKPTTEDIYAAAAAVLNEIQPIQRDLSTAVLVRSNQTGNALVNYFRAHCPGIPVVHEGSATLLDNPLIHLLLSLLKYAAHPGDTFARRHLEMSPLKPLLDPLGPDASRLPLLLLDQLATQGYQKFLCSWGDALNGVSPLDAFGRKRLQNLLDAAGEFDAMTQQSVNDFLLYIKHYCKIELGSDQAVRVMTIHQSKGLGFDVVILPELLTRTSIGQTHGGLAVHTQRDWVLDMPRQAVANLDPVLRCMQESLKADRSFEDLCGLYVALTRAKRGLYLITAYPGENAKAMNSAAFIKGQLGVDSLQDGAATSLFNGQVLTHLYECGKRDWYSSISLHAPTEEPPEEMSVLPSGYAKRSSQRRRFVRISPSGQEETEISADQLFAESGQATRNFGTAIHDLFEQLEWLDLDQVDAIANEWFKSYPADEEVRKQVVEQFNAALSEAEVQDALRRPEGATELWREQQFEIILKNRWVTGTFDRVTLFEDSAVVLDYKSNRVHNDEEIQAAAEHYRPQLNLYREVLASMLDMKPSKIRLKLLFTVPQKVVEL